MGNLSKECPVSVHLTNDRSLLYKADVVIFNLPHLPLHIEGKIEKREGQLWIGWCLESEANYPWVFSYEMKQLIDLWMTYQLDSDIPIPYLNESFIEMCRTSYKPKRKDICMFVSSPVNKSRRIEYIKELMRYVHIDSYGRLFNNIQLFNDSGFLMKQQIASEYKFVIAFENSISTNYVTEKFYDPLINGSVPVYLGAPDIELFTPGKGAYLDVHNYREPKEMAQDLLRYCSDERLYKEKFFGWKTEAFNYSFLEIANQQRVHFIKRLLDKVNGYMPSSKEKSYVKIGKGAITNYE